MTNPRDTTEADRPSLGIVGRDQELRVLDEALQSARAGRGKLVLVGGELGIGKTALVRRFLAARAGESLTALTGGTYDLAVASPFSLWRDLLGSPAAIALGASTSNGLLASFADDPLNHLVDWLVDVARAAPVVLHLEDLHWADAESLEFLRQLAWRISTEPILIVATYRDVDIGPGNPLYQQLPALIRETGATHLALGRLGKDAVRGLVAAAWPMETDDLDQLADYVYAIGQGNPFASNELLRTLSDHGVLVADDRNPGRWRLGALDRVVVPPLVRHLVDTRIAEFGADGRCLLEFGAILGEEIPAGRLALWRELAGVDDDAFRSIIDQAIERFVLVEVDRAGALRFHHALVREALYDAIGPVRRHDLHRRVGNALAACGRPVVDEVAFHLYRARDPAGVDWLVRAAEEAQRIGGWATAASRFEEAIDLARSAPGSAGAVGWLLYRAALMRRFADLRRSLELLDEARAVARDTHDAALAVGTRYHRGFVLCWLRHVQAGIAEMAAAVAEMDCLSDADYARLQVVESFGSRERGEHRGTLNAWYCLTGRYREAIAATDKLEDAPPSVVGRVGLSRSSAGDAYSARATSLAMLGKPEQALPLYETARELYVAISHSHQIGWSYLDELLHVAIPYHADDIGRRDLLARQASSAWERSSSSGGAPLAAVAALPLQLLEGHWQAARETGARLAPNDRMGWIVAPVLATIAVQSVDHQLLSRVVADVLPAGHQTAPGSTAYAPGYQLLYLSALARVLWGEPEAAPPWLDAMERWLAWSGAVPGRAELAVARAVHAFATARLSDLDRYARDAVALASSPRQPIVLTLARRLLARSLVHAGRTVEARAELDASIALARICRNRLEEAIGMVMLSELQNRAGDHETARATLDQAVATFNEIGATSWASFVRRAREWWGMAEGGTQTRHLSRRETEVLRLVANGLTDAEVAAQLCVSRRTVTTHLSSVYEKLGVSSRAAATRIAVERHLI